MMGRSYEETVSVLTKGLKNAESTGRAEIMVTLGKSTSMIRKSGTSKESERFSSKGRELKSKLEQ